MTAARASRLAVVVVAAAIAWAAVARRGTASRGADRDVGVVRALADRGLEADPGGILWLDTPPFSVWRSLGRSVPFVVRARPAREEPFDIYLGAARLSPEGALLAVGRTYNVTETSAVDELRPVGNGGAFAYAEQTEGLGSAVRLVDLAGEPASGRAGWSRRARLQAALTRLQDTGRLDGLRRATYRIASVPADLSVAMSAGVLRILADGRTAEIALDRPLECPPWLAVESQPEPAPGNLTTWGVDRVRAEIGDEAMQYVKAVAFSLLDVVLRRKEELTGDTGAEGIAEELGTQSLEAGERAVPVDPDIGFPPPPLEPWVTPPLPGEGAWQAKSDDPFIASLPGLPPTFVTTFIRADRTRKATRVYAVLWDPRLVQLNMMAGVAEPKSATGATGPGLIPREPSVMRRVAAAMNAGFQALHGEFGMMGDGVLYLPPKPYGATVVQTTDGSTHFGTWPEDPRVSPDIVSYRQNMTPLVLDGRFNPYRRTWWGGTPSDWEDKTHTVRTGICLTKESFVAYFYGADLSPEALAQAMLQTRCSYGIALDMNAGHSGLEFYRVAPESELPELGRPLDPDAEREGDVNDMDGWKFRARRLIRGMGLMNFPRYIRREGRDFFYLTVRHVLPGSPIPVRGAAGAREGDGTWQVKGLPQHGFPYALALTELPLEKGQRLRVLRVDPRMLALRAPAPVPPATAVTTAAPSEAAAAQPRSNDPVVLAMNVAPSAAGGTSLWYSTGAFFVGPDAPVEGALRLATGTADARVRAASGVEDESGMLVYVELADPAAAVPAAELARVLASVGVGSSIAFAEPLELALGGDTSLTLAARRLPAAGDAVTFFRKPGAGGARMFEATPVVPFEIWYPLQSRRIRYFKKAKDADP